MVATAAIPCTEQSGIKPRIDDDRWRDWKLRAFESVANDLVVEIKNPTSLSDAERDAILARIRVANMAIYSCPSSYSDQPVNESQLKQLGSQLGLERLDANIRVDKEGISRLKHTPGVSDRYIPYSNQPLNWHTDGYYNRADQQICAFIIHCIAQAQSGGESSQIDHEIAYLLVRDANPDFINALCETDVMTIPANVVDGKVIRPDSTGPVFSRLANGELHMRYTARTRSIVWKDSDIVAAARNFLDELLQRPSRWRITHRLQPGQGLICNNVLHCRGAYVDDATSGHQREVLRARYHDRTGNNF